MISFYGNGLISSGESAKIYSNTTEVWNEQSTLISEENTFYIYTDYKIENEINIPGLKIGDGSSYLIDLPFVAAGEQDLTQVFQHINNTNIHISQEEKTKWNNATRVIASTTQPNNGKTGDIWLVLTSS